MLEWDGGLEIASGIAWICLVEIGGLGTIFGNTILMGMNKISLS